jgi:hypothetical protein
MTSAPCCASCDERIRIAVQDEREACAAIADDYVRDAVGTLFRTGRLLIDEQKGRVEAAEKIAEAIRERSYTNGGPHR